MVQAHSYIIKRWYSSLSSWRENADFKSGSALILILLGVPYALCPPSVTVGLMKEDADSLLNVSSGGGEKDWVNCVRRRGR